MAGETKFTPGEAAGYEAYYRHNAAAQSIEALARLGMNRPYPAWCWHTVEGDAEPCRYIRVDIADDLFAALEPFSKLEIPKHPQGNAGAYSIYHEWIVAARIALDKARKGDTA